MVAEIRHSKRIAVDALLLCLFAAVILTGPCGVSRAGAPVPDPVYVFSGRGRAHGVGLCMDGVYYRALAGHSYRPIISYYYTGIDFGKVDDGISVRVKCRDDHVRTYSMREYLYRLAEEPDTYPYEGLRVLFVAARTYVLSCINRGKHSNEGFDVCSSGNCCQAFNENKDVRLFPNSVRAVNETTGEIITFNGSPIVAAYHGSCGGHTENNEDVWGSKPIPYLRGKPDEYCFRSSRFSWTVRLKRSEMEARLNSFEDTTIADLYAIDLVKRTPGGRVATAVLRGSAHVKTVKGAVLSSRLGLPSTLFDILPCNFDEYITLFNPHEKPARVDVSFMLPTGESAKHGFEISARSRHTLKVNDYLQFREHSTAISSSEPLVSERVMYFNYGGKTGGSVSAGTEGPGTVWYFAEGYTAGDFDTYVLLLNPYDKTAEVVTEFMNRDGKARSINLSIAPTSRATLRLDDIPSLENSEVSTVVRSSNGVPVVAERATYFGYGQISGGNAEPGIRTPRKSWYFAEGYTAGGFSTYFLVLNPGPSVSRLLVSFMREDGGVVAQRVEVPPRSRWTLDAKRVPGIENASFSTGISSENGIPVVAERSMFFTYGGIRGGHDSRGAGNPSTRWYFGEGYTGHGFDTYFLICNPSGKRAELNFFFARPSGEIVKRSLVLPPRTRTTLFANAVEEINSSEFATEVRSLGGVGVVTERATYFRYPAVNGVRDGGHVALGACELSSRRFFAEGYTGY